MIEFLEAPVPLLVGISDEYLRRTLPKDRPRSVVFVHLDENKVFFENSDYALLDKVAIHPLPVRLLIWRSIFISH